MSTKNSSRASAQSKKSVVKTAKSNVDASKKTHGSRLAVEEGGANTIPSAEQMRKVKGKNAALDLVPRDPPRSPGPVSASACPAEVRKYIRELEDRNLALVREREDMLVRMAETDRKVRETYEGLRERVQNDPHIPAQEKAGILDYAKQGFGTALGVIAAFVVVDVLASALSPATYAAYAAPPSGPTPEAEAADTAKTSDESDPSSEDVTSSSQSKIEATSENFQGHQSLSGTTSYDQFDGNNGRYVYGSQGQSMQARYDPGSYRDDNAWFDMGDMGDMGWDWVGGGGRGRGDRRVSSRGRGRMTRGVRGTSRGSKEAREETRRKN